MVEEQMKSRNISVWHVKQSLFCPAGLCTCAKPPDVNNNMFLTCFKQTVFKLIISPKMQENIQVFEKYLHFLKQGKKLDRSFRKLTASEEAALIWHLIKRTSNYRKP